MILRPFFGGVPNNGQPKTRGRDTMLQELYLDPAFLLAGFIGGIMHALWALQRNVKVDLVPALTSIVFGTFTSNYLGHTVAHYINETWIQVPDVSGGLITGFLAVPLLAFLLSFAKS